MIQVLERVSRILDFVADNPETPKTLGAIARYAGLNPGTCANIVKTLCEQSFLEQVDRRRGYIMGPRVYYLARNGPYRKDIVSVVEPFLTHLASEVHETVLIAILHRGKRSVLFQVDGNNVLQIRNDYLLQEQIYSNATGRLLLSFLSAAELESFIKLKGLPDKNTWPEAASLKKLKERLNRIRKQGMLYYLKNDLAAISFPIRQQGRVIAALGLFLPEFRFKGKRRKLILKRMKKASEEISDALSSVGEKWI
jgi:DNA-binding IclR family transcriptional regulator